ncbi:MAG TPA: CopG family transcriptional regulator [Euryarchaeota archaeon]|nr:hypothetical protein BMS3Bbin15_01845 [archaeon BMS3Bbin15]HDL15179.1 CopG family transcriptional regulator [Euryarchaeota archaeon]
MVGSERLTISVGPAIKEFLKKYKKYTGKSHSEIIREALKNYFELMDGDIYSFNPELGRLYYEMLSSGEHIILDIDHWMLFLREVNSKDRTGFWKEHRAVARSHAEQFAERGVSPMEVLQRLEACNLFTLSKNSDTEFTIVLSSDVTKKFIKTFLEEVFRGMNLKVEVREDYSKLRMRIIEDKKGEASKVKLE